VFYMPELRTKTYPRRGGNGSLLLLLFLVIICVAVLTSQSGFEIPFFGTDLLSPTVPPLPTISPAQSSTSVTMESMQWYAVQVGSFATLEEAETAAADAHDKGGAGFVYKDGSYRVLVSSYLTQTEADEVRQKIAGTYPNAAVYKLKSDEILLSIVAAPLQSSALSQGFSLLPELVRELQRLSLSLDRGTMDVSSVRAAAATNLTRTDSLIANMELTLAGSTHQLVSGLIKRLTDCSSALKQISNTPDTEVSAQLKLSQLEILGGYLDFSKELTSFGTK
jgi:hypothetical protein